MESMRTALNCDYEAVETAVKSLGEAGESEVKILTSIERGTYRSPAGYTAVETLREALQKHCPPEKRTFVMVPELCRYRSGCDSSGVQSPAPSRTFFFRRTIVFEGPLSEFPQHVYPAGER